MGFIQKIKDSLAADKKYRDQLLFRYKTGDYVKVASGKQIRELYYSAPKETMCVIDKNNIYVARGIAYEWKRYKYNVKRDELVHIFKRTAQDIDNSSPYYAFKPNQQAINAIKEKPENLRTEEEAKVLRNRKININSLIIELILLCIIIGFEVIRALWL